MKDILGIDLKPEETQEDTKEYFTIEFEGKPCKCWLFATKLIPDLEGKLYAQGYLFDGAEHHTIKVYLSK